MQKAALYVAGLIFAVGACAHVVRLATGFPIAVNHVAIPYWVSFPGVLVAGGLAIWMLMAARKA